MNLKDLQKKIPYKWKVQSYNFDKTKGQCVAYIDARDVQDLLDDVVGAENWQSDFKLVDNKLFGGIGIRINDAWVWKWDTGTESNIEEEKGQVSDAFKRSGVQWGIGRFLYGLDIVWVDIVDKHPIDKSGKRIWDLTEYIENQKKPLQASTQDDLDFENPTTGWRDKNATASQLAALDARLKKLGYSPKPEDYKNVTAGQASDFIGNKIDDTEIAEIMGILEK